MAKKTKAGDKNPNGTGTTGVVGLGPGVTLPQGITIQRPTPSFSPDLQQALESARKSHGYYVTVTEADQQGNLKTKSFRGSGFSPDWLLRAHQLATQHILNGDLNPKPEGGA